MVKLADIARETGFSTCTVSKVLNGGSGAQRYSVECRDKVREAAQRLGYHRNFAGRALRRGRTDTLGIVLPDWTSYGLMDPFMAAILGSVESAVRQQGLQTLVLGTEDLEKFRATLSENRTDGVIACTFNDHPALTRLLEDCGQPVIRLFGVGSGKLPAVRLDQKAGTYAATDHLAELGHQGLAWITPAVHDQYGVSLRRQGFIDAATKHGLETADLCLPTSTGEGLIREIESAAKLVADQGANFWKRFTGIVCYHDPIAFGALEGLRRLGLAVPRDVSVVGFDNVVAPLASPPLTSVDFMLRDATDTAVQMLLSWLSDGSAPASDASIIPVLHVGESSGKVLGSSRR